MEVSLQKQSLKHIHAPTRSTREERRPSGANEVSAVEVRKSRVGGVAGEHWKCKLEALGHEVEDLSTGQITEGPISVNYTLLFFKLGHF